MSVAFSDICKIAGAGDLTFAQNPGKILLGFWPAAGRFSSDYLYALRASELSRYEQLDNCNLLIYADIPIPTAYYSITSLNFIVSRSAESFEKLQYQAQQVFDNQARINNYAYSLLTVCRSSGDIRRLMELCYNRTLNPILFADTSLCLQAYVGISAGMQSAILRFCLQEKRMPPAFLHELSNGTRHRQDPAYPQLMVIEPNIKDLSDSQIVICPVLREEQLRGYLALFAYNHSIANMDKELLIILSDFVSITDSGKALPERGLHAQAEDFIRSILSGQLRDEDAIEQRCEAYHLNKGSACLVCSVKSAFSEDSQDKAAYYRRRLCQIFSRCTSVYYQGFLVLVTDEEDFQLSRDAFYHFLLEAGCLCTISLPFKKYTRLLAAWRQTVACMDMHMTFRLKATLMFYRDWKLTHLLFHFREVCGIEDMIHRDVRRLLEWDAQRGSDLTGTLFAYVHCRQDITTAAKELHLHYNTLKYRIQKIRELTDIDFGDYQYMFQIIMLEKALHLMRLLKHQTEEPI